jgi:hypothetical protein
VKARGLSVSVRIDHSDAAVDQIKVAGVERQKLVDLGMRG